ncbi:DNA primase [Novosphingobium marinum]|uniref:DNA primase n=1 Tax=Novosphingobium marinum TaxID=1514948 RepID=A0A7Y9XTG0_9SPHN|nr:DNA primase [Novosphingobium marinum]NYH94152.1 DNA primase [Novosphingobium marinum]GGC19995.1 DNA primase [Novosphingobium marinum]
MALSPQWLDELRSRLTLSSVIGRSTRLTKAGREFKACCPFHNEKTPSFTVSDEKGFYHCFGCGAHGDVIRWMTDQRGLSFMDAVKELASEAGMDVPAPDPREARRAEQRASLHDVMAAAQEWFVANLRGPDGEKARRYLEGRGFDAHTIARFGFGYAPEDRQALKAALLQFPDEMLVEAGLRIAVDGRDPYDRFRGRLMLPIEDTRGRVIAFGGRILDAQKTDAPKYLNSPDTPLFDKGRTLYNLHRAAPAARQSGRLIVVEGYMDAIALSAAGIDEVVAPLGTALTEQQIELLWRHVETPVLCFDGDAAGQRAAMRAVSRALPLLRPAHSLRLVTLPAGLDPDDLLKKQGVAAMERLLADARGLLDTLWLHERDAAPLSTPEDKAGLKARLLDHVDAIAHPDIKALYKRELLERFSAYAFPPRQRTWRGKPADGAVSRPPSAENVAKLRAAIGTGGRDALSAAVIAGLIRFPEEIARHDESLARLAASDRRFGILLDSCDAVDSLESEGLAPILSAKGLEVPAPSEYAARPFGFLRPDTPRDLAVSELAQAIDLLVERPALEAALAEATERFESELSEEAYEEQQRLLKRKLEFDARLRQMASSRAAVP